MTVQDSGQTLFVPHPETGTSSPPRPRAVGGHCPTSLGVARWLPISISLSSITAALATDWIHSEDTTMLDVKLKDALAAFHQIRNAADAQIRTLERVLDVSVDPVPPAVRVPGKPDLTAAAREWLHRRWKSGMPAAEAARLLGIHPRSALKWFGRFAQDELTSGRPSLTTST